jgi:UDP-glucose 4-epimerase
MDVRISVRGSKHLKSMKVLVTGGAGYIGSHVVRQLSEAGHVAIVLDDLSTGNASSLINGETLIQGDVGDKQLLDEVFTKHAIEAVFHFAGSIIVPESVADPIKYYTNNTVKTLTLLDACVRHQVKNFIFSGTASVYGMPPAGYVSEDDLAAPLSPYGTSKLVSEWMLGDVALAYGLKYVILRYFNVAGADPQARMGQRSVRSTHLIKVCCEAVLGIRDHVEIFGTDYSTPDGTCLRDYIHVEDLASAHLSALNYLNRGGGSLTANVGYGVGYSVHEVIETVKRVSGVNFKTVLGPRRPGDVESVVAQVTRVTELLKWKPRSNNLESIIRDALRWEMKMRSIKAARIGSPQLSKLETQISPEMSSN